MSIRHACGMTRPTNPMTPTNATQTEVRMEATTIISALNILTFSPSCLAWSSPDMKRLNSLAHSMAMNEIASAGMRTRKAFSQVMLAKEPYSHHMTLVRLSFCRDRKIVWTEVNANPTIVPARM